MVLQDRLNNLGHTWCTIGTQYGHRWIYVGYADEAKFALEKIWEMSENGKGANQTKKKSISYRAKLLDEKKTQVEYYKKKYNDLLLQPEETEYRLEMQRKGRLRYLETKYDESVEKMKFAQIVYDNLCNGGNIKSDIWLNRNIVEEFNHMGFWDNPGLSLIIVGDEDGKYWTDDEMRDRRG